MFVEKIIKKWSTRWKIFVCYKDFFVCYEGNPNYNQNERIIKNNEFIKVKKRPQ